MVDSKQEWKAWVYLAPALILLLIFTIWPIINTFHFALLTDYNSLGHIAGETYSVGFGNFVKVVGYKDFLKCLKNTTVLCVLTVPISCFLALLIAVFLNSIPRCSRLLQTIFFLPYVTNTIAIGMVFSIMFNIIGVQSISDYDKYVSLILRKDPSYDSFIASGGTNAEFMDLHPEIYVRQLYNEKIVMEEGVAKRTGYIADSWGIINNFLIFLNFEPVQWISPYSSTTANYAVLVIYIVWNALPFKILILLGGLQSVNKQYYDAAKIDGASRSTVFFRITVPLLSPMLAYVLITGFIGGFKEYTSVVGIFGPDRGPSGIKGRMNTIVGYIYDSLAVNNYGVASAASLVLFGIILVVTLINLYVSSKKVTY